MGKSSKLKIKKIKEKERQQVLLQSLRDSKKVYKKTAYQLQAFWEGEMPYDRLPEGSGHEKIAQILQGAGDINADAEQKNNFYQLLQRLVEQKGESLLEDADIVNGLYTLSLYGEKFIRPLSEWSPRSRNRNRQFSHLLRFLLARYEVPVFLDEAFYKNKTTEAAWFIHIGRGGNIRKAEHLPVPLTKKMAHHFLKAPADYSIVEAFRYGQIMGMGGSKNLVSHVNATRLGRRLEHEEFWATFLQFLANQTAMDYAQINPLVDYIRYQKFLRRRVVLGRGQIEEVVPPQPDFSMKGRTLTALLRQVEEWHRILNRERHQLQGITWLPADVMDFELVEHQGKYDERIYQIRQLLTVDELGIEGQAMKHCVAGYAYACTKGNCSIWSLTQKDIFQGTQRLVTIEMDKNFQIVQARGKYNAFPTLKAQEIIRRWAAESNLKLSKWLHF